MGWKFGVLPQGFLTHYPHGITLCFQTQFTSFLFLFKIIGCNFHFVFIFWSLIGLSDAKKNWVNHVSARKQNDQAFASLLSHLQRTYGKTLVKTPMCEKGKKSSPR
jgi:hypothetical protein